MIEGQRCRASRTSSHGRQSAGHRNRRRRHGGLQRKGRRRPRRAAGRPRQHQILGRVASPLLQATASAKLPTLPRPASSETRVFKATLELRRYWSRPTLDTPTPSRASVSLCNTADPDLASAHAGCPPACVLDPAQVPILTRSCRLRGRPTDAPLKNAPLSKYFLLNTLSTYNCGRTIALPTANEYPTLALTMTFGSTWMFLLKSNRPRPYVESGSAPFVRPDP